MVETTSLMLNLCFKYPTRAPSKAPVTNPMITTRGFAITPFKEEYPISTVERNAPASICPETPILKRPAFNAISTASAANSMGVRAFKKLVKSVIIPLCPA